MKERAKYEYKIFQTPATSPSIKLLNALLESLGDYGWEPVEVDSERGQILAKREISETLHD